MHKVMCIEATAILDVPWRTLSAVMQMQLTECERIVFYDCSIAGKIDGEWCATGEGLTGGRGEAAAFVECLGHQQ